MNVKWLARKIEWSLKTFGPDQRSEGVLQHIEKEIKEVRENPNDILEWIDIVLLALDGAMRCGIGRTGPNGYSAKEISRAMVEKQRINRERKWGPKPAADEPSFHIK